MSIHFSWGIVEAAVVYISAILLYLGLRMLVKSVFKNEEDYRTSNKVLNGVYVVVVLLLLVLPWRVVDTNAVNYRAVWNVEVSESELDKVESTLPTKESVKESFHTKGE